MSSPVGVSAALPGARMALMLLLAINLMNYIDRYIISATLPMIERDEAISPADNPITKTQLGLLAPAFVWTYMIFSLLFGVLGDRMSRWTLVGIGVILWSFASGGSGLATSFLVLLGTRCLVGIGEAAYGPTAPTLLSDLFPVERRGFVMALFYMAIPVGSALGFIIGGLIGEKYGWRWAFYLAMPPGLILGVLCFFMREPAVGAADKVAKSHESHVPKWDDYRSLIRIRSYVFNSAAATGMCFAIGGLSYWMPYYLYERESKLVWTETTLNAGIKERIPAQVMQRVQDTLPSLPYSFENAAEFRTKVVAAIGTSEFATYRESLLMAAHGKDSISLGTINLIFGGILAVGGLTATLFGGYVGDWLRQKYPGSYFLVSGVSVIIGLPLFLMTLYLPLPIGWVVLFLAVFALFVNTGPSNTILANVVPPSIRSSAFAINILLIHALGDAISPAIIGAIADQADLRTGFLLVSAMILVSGIVWMLGARYLQADTEAAPTLLEAQHANRATAKSE
ncbi:spinster family MFS transporter [Tuwongella immobilis]|uniref:Major facilitator superfamily (MFS) profile domain-containing protein n=1 Tax=Tuwongella immobilis TaxID=692036 RepID=A0A6C2YWL8_9BACT|nr:MFS transporter [Tuwongella immobilis]VIP05543.1 mfs transporter : Major facilitator superfamily MFS_1 OS=Chthoniobacter flavus Ellin428 GN=CfE428DRAFT_5659 PE=4 SV=1: MFS_1 [Tuwongella immobilis]VTS08442.1 mfs transporter : Major facilitator superfamily MFS_1 OS=Chthoniobacter flavus Ellin428 GN=CfE428DRAFT_5659 PE=4 SV=1: MFS_1 [Tuwongella immobilis]